MVTVNGLKHVRFSVEPPILRSSVGRAPGGGGRVGALAAMAAARRSTTELTDDDASPWRWGAEEVKDTLVPVSRPLSRLVVSLDKDGERADASAACRLEV